MTRDVYFGRKVAVTGAAAVLETLDTSVLGVPEGGFKDNPTPLSRRSPQPPIPLYRKDDRQVGARWRRWRKANPGWRLSELRGPGARS